MSIRTPALRDQQIFLPELLTEKVEAGPHAARFFLYLAETLELQLYKSWFMGAPRYSRQTLVAVILYAMYNGHFEYKNIEGFVHDSIGAQWILNGMHMPSYKTVERVITALLDELDDIFTQILALCEQQGLVGKACTYIDGVKTQANASKHKAMSYEYLGKKIKRGKEDLKELFTALRDVITESAEISEEDFRKAALEDAVKVHGGLRKNHLDALKARQDRIFGDDIEAKTGDGEEKRDMEAIKGGLEILKSIEPERHDEAMETLNNIAFVNKRVTRMEDATAELEDKWKAEHGNKKIPETQQINFTDSDSCIMQTKHHGVQQCYNNFALVDNKANIILGTYTSNNSSDQLGLKPCVENSEKTYGSLAGFKLGGDAGFFSAGNISYAIGKGIDFYASYPEAKSPYAKDKFKYDEAADKYTCPEGNTLSLERRLKDGGTCLYSNEAACHSCSKHWDDCTKSKDGVRRIERDMVNDKLREEAREKASSEEGLEILRLRKSIPEPVWGNIKTQDGFTQMHYRGIEKAGLEFELHCLIQNIRKLLKTYFNRKAYQDIVHKKCGGCLKIA
jgi:transposase